MGRPRELSQEERADLMRRGYRPVEIWVPDVGNEALRLQLQEEARRIAAADKADDIMDWVEAAGPTDWTNHEAEPGRCRDCGFSR